MSRLTKSPHGDRQGVIDPDHRCNYSQIPHLLLDDVASGHLHPAAVVLYLHYRRAAFEQHGRPVDETLRETKERTGLSNGTILTARDELEQAGWLRVEKAGSRGGQSVTITLVERWEDNCEHHGHLGQNLTKSHLRNGPFKTLEDVKDPLGGDDDEARVYGHDVPLPSMALIELSSPGLSISPAVTPEELVAGLYRGLGVDPTVLTPRVYRREIEIAHDLIAAGETPAEAEAYARETNVPGRRAAVDMNSFEHDRASWRSRHQRVVAPPLMKVVNGRMPE